MDGVLVDEVICMSYTGIYSILFNKKGEEGVEIKNWKGFMKFVQEVGFSIYDWLHENYIVGCHPPYAEIKVDLTDLDVKPRVVLFGFKTFDYPSVPYNIERLAYYYDKTRFIEFWSKLSEYTKPFWFLHSPLDRFVPNIFDVYLDDDCRELIKVECNNGNIKITKIKFNLTANGGVV